MEDEYRPQPSVSFESVPRNREFRFLCNIDCQVGAYPVQENEPLRVISDGDGLFSVYVAWGDGAIARMNARDINKLAGFEMIRRANHFVGGES